MAKIWTLLLVLTLSTMFIHVPHRGEIVFLLNPDVTLSYNQFVWMSTTYLFPIIYVSIIHDETKTRKNLVLVYLLLMVADFIGFILSYDDPLKDYVLTFNVLKLLIFLAAIGWDNRQLIWNQLRHVLSVLRS